MESTMTLPNVAAPPLLPPPAGASNFAAQPAPAPAPPQRGFRLRPLYVFLVAIFLFPLFIAIGVTGYFRLSSPVQALRSSVTENVPGQWDKKFALHVGPITLGLVRIGSSFFNVPPEPKAALRALRGAEVGIYRLERPVSTADYPAIFAAADKAMKRRGWDRIVGVSQHGQLVAVYAPRNLRAFDRIACCVVVLNDDKLVVAGGRGNLEPLLELARDRGLSFDKFASRFPKS